MSTSHFSSEEDWSVVNISDINIGVQTMVLGNIEVPEIKDDWEYIRTSSKSRSYLDAVLHVAFITTEASNTKPATVSSSWKPAVIVVNDASVSKKRSNREYVSDVQQIVYLDDEADGFYCESMDLKHSIGMQRLKSAGRISAKVLEKKMKRIAMKAPAPKSD
jgi:hypothetical protein